MVHHGGWYAWVRADRQPPLNPLHGADAWDGLPPAFEEAAGLSSQVKNWLDAQSDPGVRDQTRGPCDPCARGAARGARGHRQAGSRGRGDACTRIAQRARGATASRTMRQASVRERQETHKSKR